MAWGLEWRYEVAGHSKKGHRRPRRHSFISELLTSEDMLAVSNLSEKCRKTSVKEEGEISRGAEGRTMCSIG